MNISSPEFQVWQHLEDHWNTTQLHKLANVPTVPVAQLYKHMIDNNRHILPFQLAEESTDDTGSNWTLFSHTGIYVMSIGSLIPAGLGLFCYYFFWCWPALLACGPLWSGSMQHTFVDDDVEAAPIYRSKGRAGQPFIRPHKNQTWMWSRNLHGQRVNRSNKHSQKQSLNLDSWIEVPKIQGMWWAHMVCCKT